MLEDSRYLTQKIQEIKTEKPKISWKEMAKELGVHPEKLRSLYRRNNDRQQFGSEDEFEEEDDYEIDPEIFCEDKKFVESVNWRELIEYAEQGSDINQRLGVYQEIGTVDIPANKPIAVVYTGDWHLGSSIVNYEEWKRGIQLIMDTDKLYMVTLGDDNENMRSFRTLSTVLSQVLSPSQQVSLMFSLVDELTRKHKLLAKVAGNHDGEFDERIFGQSLMSYLYNNLTTPVFENRGVLKIKVGEQTYTNLLFHKSRFKSFIRPVHGAFREWQMSYPAEVVVGAHDHVPGAEIMLGYTLPQQDGLDIGGEVFLLKVGSYQEGGYGWRYFHNGGIMNPTVVYYPDQHKKLLFTCPEDALQYIR